MRVTLLCVLVVVASATPAQAEEPLERLVQRLATPRYGQREQAAAALRSAGAAAVPLLEKALTSADPEVRRRAAHLLEELAPLVDGQKVLLPQKIKLNYQDLTVLQALEDFARQTRLPLMLDRDERTRLSKRRLTLRTEELPFWEAYERLLVAAKLSEHAGPLPRGLSPVSLSGDSRFGSFGPPSSRSSRPSSSSSRGPTSLSSSSLLLIEGQRVHFPTTFSGALRIQATEPAEGRTPKGEAPVTLTCYPEPRIRWQQIEYIRIDRAVDVLGRKLATGQGYVRQPPIPTDDTSSIVEIPRSSRSRSLASRQATLWLRAPDSRARVVEELKGVIGAVVETDSEPLVRIDNVATAADKVFRASDGTRVKVVTVEIDVERKRVQLRLEIDRPQGFNESTTFGRGSSSRSGRSLSTRAELEQHGLALLDKKGERLFVSRGEWQRQEEGSGRIYVLQFEPILDQATEPMRLVVSGRRLALIEVPFALRNVPLP